MRRAYDELKNISMTIFTHNIYICRYMCRKEELSGDSNLSEWFEVLKFFLECQN